jgi:hypothetical protein
VDEKSQERKIRAFLRGNIKKIDAFCLYQWLERCHFHHWWALGISLGSQIPPNALNQEYQKRAEFLRAECHRFFADEQKLDEASRCQQRRQYPYRTRLIVSNDEALSLLRQIGHAKFNNTIRNYWFVNDGFVKAQSVLWLFCWGKTGNGSTSTAISVREIFDDLFAFTYASFDERVDHEWARKMRYSSRDIEEELEHLLS